MEYGAISNFFRQYSLGEASGLGAAADGSMTIGSGAAAGGGAAAIDEVLARGIGPLTAEGLFLLMCEMLESQDLRLGQKMRAFRDNTALQNKYNEFNEWMQAAQSAATKSAGGCLSRDDVESMLKSKGYEEPQLGQMADAIFEHETGGKGGFIEPNELAEWLNESIFGAGNEHLYVTLAAPEFKDGKSKNEYTSGSFMASHFEVVGEKVEAKQKTVCADTSMMSSELSQLVSEKERLTSMFTNILKKFHDTEMAVIRNI